MKKPPRCAHPGCKNHVKWIGGRPPKFCKDHRANKKRDEETQIKRAAKGAGADVIDLLEHLPEETLERRAKNHQIKRESATRATIAMNAWRSRQLAIALGWEKDPRRAAALIGLELPPAELELLVKDAQQHRGLITRDKSAIGDLINGALALRATAVAGGFDDNANNLRRLVQTMIMVLEGGEETYTQLRDVLKLREGETCSMEDLLPPELRTVRGGKSG